MNLFLPVCLSQASLLLLLNQCSAALDSWYSSSNGIENIVNNKEIEELELPIREFLCYVLVGEKFCFLFSLKANLLLSVDL